MVSYDEDLCVFAGGGVAGEVTVGSCGDEMKKATLCESVAGLAVRPDLRILGTGP